MIEAKYTEVLYNLIKNERTKNLINQAMSTYPLYVSTSKFEYGQPNIIPTREELNDAILNYYKYREIGFETVGRFLDELETSLKEIMPYYNQLYYSADQDYNLIYNVDYVRTINRDLDGTNTNKTKNNTETESSATDSSSTSGETENFGKAIKSLTPQNVLNISNKNIDTVTYGDEASWTQDSTTSSTTNNGTTSTTANSENTIDSDSKNKELENTIETTKGNFGVTSAQDLIKKYREIVINITQQVINDPRIAELFMLVY